MKSNVAEERLGRVLYRYGHLGEEALKRVEASTAAGKRFGEIAVELGEVSRESIYKAFGQQVTDVVVGAMHVDDGTYFFLDGFNDTELATRLAVSINGLLMDGVTRMDEVKYFAEKIPSFDHVPIKAPGANTDGPTETFLEFFNLIDGKTSVRELGRRTGLGEFETMKKVYGLLQSKHVQMRPPLVDGGPVALVHAANEVMGILFKKAKGAGKDEDLAQGLSAFCVGAGVFYDLLFRGAGPDGQGRLVAEVVAENAPMVAQGEDVEQALRKLLFDYVSFAVFSLGAALGHEGEAELHIEVDLPLSVLRPTA